MKKIIYAVLATLSGLVLLFSYKTSLGDPLPVAIEAAIPGAGKVASASPATSAPSAPTTTGSSSGTSTLKDGTYAGSAVNTRYGPVAVSVTVSHGEIAAVDVTDYPASNQKDKQINQRAIPQLVSETLSAQSAQIDMVSGATYTSGGYLTSLQSALDHAAA